MLDPTVTACSRCMRLDPCIQICHPKGKYPISPYGTQNCGALRMYSLMLVTYISRFISESISDGRELASPTTCQLRGLSSS